MSGWTIRKVPVEQLLHLEHQLGIVGILTSYAPTAALGAFEDGRLIGAATTCGNWIPGVVVDPAYRRRGVGRALFMEAFRLLLERGAAEVRVQPCSANGWALVNSLPQEVQERLYVKEDIW